MTVVLTREQLALYLVRAADQLKLKSQRIVLLDMAGHSQSVITRECKCSYTTIQLVLEQYKKRVHSGLQKNQVQS
ncbi:hypothetical protein TVAG_097780 [Trichomonas vaginalis G3]|uniref:Helix-turn-helix domain-containing protein n=1 Tax=Trichomonas vaginalis (strain ATCC PRA-98 / G3) TaxID=412133 RepID=A2E2A8_TRIV3|nr:hypothetical protein TVAGG3_0964820 [Trichomonas vaginalis G3]EAY13208.1 hypothetical protein TVAG_097780 [Trichomonas vaginalis G3]KAI5488167.1 hypothetical protein TVAGG3_0964820 [Trichomonas vaginalis G3]|eukprot:XP_001325431.1 hypothetical protein [Trichomonas vaginalis G3]